MWWLFELLAALVGSSENRTGQVRVIRRPMSVVQGPLMLTYRSRDGHAYFRFRFARVGNDIRIYIVEFPNPLTGSCHILNDSQGPYICWSQAIRSTAEAKAVAALWAEATLVYQRTGRTF